MNHTKLFAAIFAMSGLVFVGCGDDGSGGAGGTGGSGGSGNEGGGGGTAGSGGTTSSSSSSSSSSSTSAAACELAGVGAPADCPAACAALYDCGALTCDGATLCKFTGMMDERTAFIGDDMGGCIATCTAQMALIAIIDPKDCGSTIDSLTGLSADFKMVCDNGITP